MNANVATPYTDKCSPPQRPELAFYSPQAEDFLFDGQSQIDIICQAGLRSVALDWSLARNTFLTPFRQGKAESLVANRFRIRIDTAGLYPGFYDVRVKFDSGMGQPIDGVCTFGVRADEMPYRDTRPADFAAFWQEVRSHMAAIPLDAEAGKMELFSAEQINQYNSANASIPPDYDPSGHKCETVESGKVSFAGPDGGRVYGWLAKPHGDGPFPTMLVLPGAGCNARPRPLEHARHGYLALDVQIHGQDVDQSAYAQLQGEEQCYAPTTGYYYYHVHQRVLHAVNYLASRPDVDPARIVVVGGSQGGRLSIVAAGIDPRIAAAVPCIAHFAHQPYLAWASACNAAAMDGMAQPGLPAPPDIPMHRCLPYYDPMNFAPDIRCPVLMNAGLIDPVSPPAHIFAVYNRLQVTEKRMVALPGLAHDWSGEFDRRAWGWLEEILR